RRTENNSRAAARGVPAHQGLAVPAPTQTFAHYASAFFAGVVNAGDGVGDETGPAVIQEFAGHQLHAPGDASHTHSVVSGTSNCARAVSAVEEVIVRVSGAGDGVDAIHIVHITIAIVVHAIGRLVIPVRVQAGLAGIAPHIGGQVFMRVADARVDHRH